MSIQSIRRAAIACAVVSMLPATAAFAAQLNGIMSAPRVTNGNPSSTLTFTNNNTLPGGAVSIDDRGFTQAGTNRHDALMSSDSGVTAAVFGTATPFTISADVTLNAGIASGNGRKEAGIEINGNPTGRALFIVNSDAREIVAFGGGLPFKSFGSGATGYTVGSTITMGVRYYPGVNNNGKGSIEYFIDRNGPAVAGGQETSGLLPVGNTEGGPNGFSLGLYGQFVTGASFATDSGTATFGNILATVPEPTSLTALAASSLLMRRRRA